jgi:hypothetical protein
MTFKGQVRVTFFAGKGILLFKNVPARQLFTCMEVFLSSPEDGNTLSRLMAFGGLPLGEHTCIGTSLTTTKDTYSD